MAAPHCAAERECGGGGRAKLGGMSRKRPCSICRRWFWPDPRVGDRQRTCGAGACREEQRRKTQEGWRTRNPEYALARRITQRAADPRSAPMRVPAPLSRLPWDIAKDEFGAQGTDFLAGFGRVLLATGKDAMGA